MSDMNIRSDSIDVEQIMRQIRARIREKRGADYTEIELQQLATVKLQQFLDPKGVRSDLVEQFRRQQPPAEALPNYVFEDTTLFETHRGPLRLIRRLLKPVLKLFFNPNKLSDALHVQAQINAAMQQQIWRRGQMEPLYYEMVHNLVVEITRLGIEVQNLTMRVESLTSRMDFDERRAKALETVVEYKPALARRAEARPAADRSREPDGSPGAPGAAPSADAERRRRRRRRRRRPGQTAADTGAAVAPGSDRGGAPAESGAREPHQAPLPNAGGGEPNGGPGEHDGDDDGEGADDQ